LIVGNLRRYGTGFERDVRENHIAPGARKVGSLGSIMNPKHKEFAYNHTVIVNFEVFPDQL